MFTIVDIHMIKRIYVRRKNIDIRRKEIEKDYFF